MPYGSGQTNSLALRTRGRRVASRSGYPVIAGPVEATAIGNLLIQARTAGTITGTLEEIRELISRTHNLTTYQPRG